MAKQSQLKVLKASDSVHIDYQVWFDGRNGNSYHSATVYINNGRYELESRYGYDYASVSNVCEILAECGYRLRAGKHTSKAFSRISTSVVHGLKRDMHKVTQVFKRS